MNIIEKRIYFPIRICQLAVVLCFVSIACLTCAVYVPSHQLTNSGSSNDTMMCTTVSNMTTPNCETEDPKSCTQWCWFKSSGRCTRIRVEVKGNVSNINLESCDKPDNNTCETINPKKKAYQCIMGECSALHGIFNCTKGEESSTGELTGARCTNVTSAVSCNFTTTDVPIVCNSKKACLNLDGLYECNYGSCARLRSPYKCEKRCKGIKSGEKDVTIRQDGIIFTANCSKAVEAKTGIEISPKHLFCNTLMSDLDYKSVVSITDCFNGSSLEPGQLGNSTNFTFLVQNQYDTQQACPRCSLMKNKTFNCTEQINKP